MKNMYSEKVGTENMLFYILDAQGPGPRGCFTCLTVVVDRSRPVIGLTSPRNVFTFTVAIFGMPWFCNT